MAFMNGNPAQGDLLSKVLMVVIIPLLLIISLTIYGNFDDATQSTWEVDVTNESHTESGVLVSNTFTLDKPPLVNGSLELYNASDKTDQLADTSYDVVDYETGEVNVTVDTSQSVYAYYTGHGGSGYDTATSVNSNAYSGFDLASILPLVIAGVAILSIVIGAFAFGLAGSRRR